MKKDHERPAAIYDVFPKTTTNRPGLYQCRSKTQDHFRLFTKAGFRPQQRTTSSQPKNVRAQQPNKQTNKKKTVGIKTPEQCESSISEVPAQESTRSRQAHGWTKYHKGTDKEAVCNERHDYLPHSTQRSPRTSSVPCCRQEVPGFCTRQAPIASHLPLMKNKWSDCR